MPKYAYLISGVSEALWVKNGHFQCFDLNDCPQDYEAQTSLAKARDSWVENTLKGAEGLVIYKFDYKPPYKYHGKVQ